MPNQDNFFVTDINYFIFRKCTPIWKLKDCIVSLPFEITYLIKGSAQYTIDGINHEVSAGDLICLREGSGKKAITYSNRLMHCFSVDFTATGPDDNRGDAILPFPTISHIGIQNDIVQLFHEFNYTWMDRQPGYLIKSRGLLLLILHRLLGLTVYNNDTVIKDYRVEQAVRYINQHYAERLTVEKLASIVSLNSAYFGALFNKETGTSVNHYIAKIRIRNAENILQSGAYKVMEVAEQCGYSDKYHFYKQFKAITGLPPSKFLPHRTLKG
jgi:AraC-like DNA-binding protein